MVFDDIIIGSGLTALATAYGLPEQRRVLVLTGGRGDALGHYDAGSNVPCFNLGFGGLGNFWHGVISVPPADSEHRDARSKFADLFRLFYPREALSDLPDGPWFYVPYTPIRPKLYWENLSKARAGRLRLVHTRALSLLDHPAGWSVHTPEGHFDGHRLWLAAGALGTPALLERSPSLVGAVEAAVSDHVILYLGQVDRREHPHIASPTVRRGVNGTWMQAFKHFNTAGLVTAKPARFSYKTLDQGIQQRSAFGLPTSGVFKKVLRAGSMGLLAESLYNKYGLFPRADILSVYAQVRVAHAYRRLPELGGIRANKDAIAARIREARRQLHFPELRASHHHELYVPGIHLHGTVNQGLMPAIATPSRIEVVDASAAQDIGVEHHSFRLMVNAYLRARSTDSP